MYARKCLFLLIPVVLAILSIACTTPAKVAEIDVPKVTLESSMADAATAQKAGNTEQALTLLKGVASRFPADKTPWVRMAQIRFDNANYSEAIMSALEALQRDPGDNISNSIVTVSGLRLATKALSDLRTQNALSGSVKIEAQDLAKLLRENLGETILVPIIPTVPTVPIVSTVSTVVKPVPRAVVRSRPVIAAKPAAISPVKTSGADVDSGKPNPFAGLK